MQEIVIKSRGLYTHPSDLAATPEGAMSTADNVVIDEEEIVSPRRGFDQLDSAFSAYTFTFSDGDISVPGNTITETSHKLVNNDYIILSSSGTLPAGIDAALTYYVVNSGPNTFQIATSRGGSAVDITAAAGGGTHTVTHARRSRGLFFYQDQVVAYISGNLLSYYDSSTGWVAMESSIKPPSGFGMRASEASQNLYLTTSTGIKKFDSVDSPGRAAGVPKALGMTATVNNPASTSAWIADDFKVVYRAVWGYRDANNNLIIGAVSQRENVTNTTGVTADITLRIEIPAGITTAHFVQLYRSSAVSIVGGDVDINDELGLIYEANPTSADITNKYLAPFDDITPDVFRGATIYTAATQEGLANNNEPPPLARDIATYKGSTFYVNTTSRHRVFLTLLSADGTNGLANDDTVVIGGVIYTAKASETVATAQFKRAAVGAGVSASQAVADTALSLIRVINRHANSTVYAYYISGGEDLPGQIVFEERSFGGDGYAVYVNNATAWSPTESNGSIAFTATAATDLLTTATPHGLTDDAPLTVASSDTLPGGLVAATTYYVVSTTSTTFKLAESIGGTAVDLTSTGTGTHTAYYGTASGNDRYKNGVYFSKTNEPEGAPLGNFFTVGSADEDIQRAIPLRDSLFIFKTDGIYRVSGEDPTSFRQDLFDATTRLIAPNTAVVLNNQIWALTDQGVVAVTEAGVQVKSRPIERTLIDILGLNASVLKQESFAISYETDRKYILFVPTSSGDTVPTQAFVYNTFTNTWTRWDLSKTCGGTNPADDKVYLGDADSAYVNQERKTFSYSDHADYKAAVTITSVSGKELVLDSLDNVAVGDVIYQSASIFAVVDAKDTDTNTVTVNISANFTAGSRTVYGAIPTKVAWVPSTGKNPGSLKLFREVTMIFRELFSGTATIAFSTDQSQAQELETLTGTSIGGWGQFPWGEILWGGVANRKPQRLLVPRNKMRATMITVEFRHSRAFTKFRMNGYSLIENIISERVAY